MSKKYRFRRFLYINYQRFFKTKRWRQEHITKYGYILIIFLFLSVLLGLDITKSSSYHIFSILFSILIISIIHSVFFNSKFDIKRNLPKYGTVNNELNYSLTIQNLKKKKEVSIFYKDRFQYSIPSVKEFINTPEPNESKRNLWDRKLLYYRWLWLLKQKKSAQNKLAELPVILPNKTQKAKVTIIPLKRGILRFELSIISRPDIFNMFYAVEYFENINEVLILPQRYIIDPPKLSSENLNISENSEFLSIISQGNEFFALRDYRDGDSIRNIHWKSWAKRGKPVVKEYQQRSFSKKVLILDVFGEDEILFEYSISIAASLISPLNNKKSDIDQFLTNDYKAQLNNNQDNILIHLAKLKLSSDVFNFNEIKSELKTITGAIIILNEINENRISFLKHLLSLKIEIYTILLTKNKKLYNDMKKYNLKAININNFNNEIKKRLNS